MTSFEWVQPAGKNRAKLLIGGTDYADLVAADGVTVYADGDTPKVELRLHITDLCVYFDDVAEIKVDPPSAALLYKLGWAPKAVK